MANLVDIAEHAGGAARAAAADHHHLEPAGGAAPHDRLRAVAARRGARRAVDADAPVAARRVRGRRCRIAGDGDVPALAGASRADTSRRTAPPRRSTDDRAARSGRRAARRRARARERRARPARRAVRARPAVPQADPRRLSRRVRRAVPFDAPDPADPADTERVAHLDVWSTLQALAGRALDGYRLYRYLADDSTHRPWDGLAVLDADKPALTSAALTFVAWFECLFERPTRATKPGPRHAWSTGSRSAPTWTTATKRLVAEEYPGRPPRLDGVVDRSQAARAEAGRREAHDRDPDRHAVQRHARTCGGGRSRTAARTSAPSGPTAPTWPGCCSSSSRWCTETTGTRSPSSCRSARIARVEGLAVTNVFGERRWIEPAGRGADDNWQRWAMFTLDVAGTAPEPADTSLLMLPTLATIARRQAARGRAAAPRRGRQPGLGHRADRAHGDRRRDGAAWRRPPKRSRIASGS